MEGKTTSWCTFLGFDLTRGSKYSLCRFLTTAVFCNIWIWIVIWLLKAPRVFSFSVRFFCFRETEAKWNSKMFDRNTLDLVCRSKFSKGFANFSTDFSWCFQCWNLVDRGAAAALWRNYLDGFLLGEVNANLRENGFKFFNSLGPFAFMAPPKLFQGSCTVKLLDS